jgi:hypothetical protein
MAAGSGKPLIPDVAPTGEGSAAGKKLGDFVAPWYFSADLGTHFNGVQEK